MNKYYTVYHLLTNDFLYYELSYCEVYGTGFNEHTIVTTVKNIDDFRIKFITEIDGTELFDHCKLKLSNKNTYRAMMRVFRKCLLKFEDYDTFSNATTLEDFMNEFQLIENINTIS